MKQLHTHMVTMILIGVTLVIAMGAYVKYSRELTPVTDPFTHVMPRPPCASRSQHDLVEAEKTGIPAPAPQNPDYCTQPVCQGSHEGQLVVRYNNTTLLRTGTATLDIATDDNSPLGTISIGPISGVAITPSMSIYSPDSTTRFTLNGTAAGANESYGDGPYEQSLRQVTYPLSISIKAWCGKHIYDATIAQELKIHDLITDKTYTP